MSRRDETRYVNLFKFRKCIYTQTAYKANEQSAQGKALGL